MKEQVWKKKIPIFHKIFKTYKIFNKKEDQIYAECLDIGGMFSKAESMFVDLKSQSE